MDATDLTPQDVVAAARRGAIDLAQDPEMRHYSPETLGLVYQQTVRNLAGAGSLANAGKAMAEDPALAHVPVEVVEAVMAASVRHFARAVSGSLKGSEEKK